MSADDANDERDADGTALDAATGQPETTSTGVVAGDKNGHAACGGRPCRHCRTRVARPGRRGLCNPCFADRAIRAAYPKGRKVARGEKVGPCRHCGKVRTFRRRMLCGTCYDRPAVREAAGGGFGHGYEGRRRRPGRRLPAEPTDALPGTEAKIRVLERRAARGEQLFHPLDARLDAADLAAALESLGGIEAYQLPPREPRLRAATRRPPDGD